MGRIKTIGIYLVLTGLVLFFTLPALAGNSDPNFKYKEGPKDRGRRDLIRYYEVLEDYSVDLASYYADSNYDKIPTKVDTDANLLIYGKQPLGWKKYPWQVQALQDHVANLPNVKWDFIELVDGILTVKKGYRWDGASNIGNDCNFKNTKDYYLRGSCLHDSIYDLMRMGYLESDFLGNVDYDHDGFLNRLMADCLMHMIFKEDGESTKINEFKIVRYGGAPNTQRDATNLCGYQILAGWKYHASRLTAWPSPGGIDLHFLPADASLKDPDGSGTESQLYCIWRKDGSADSEAEWQDIALISNGNSSDYVEYYHEDWAVYYTDTTVKSGKIYSYKLTMVYDGYDESNIVTAATPNGRGNALYLSSYPPEFPFRDFLTADTVSNELTGSSITFEAWVYPEEQDSMSSVLAFNTPTGHNHNLLMYDGENNKFSYYDESNGHVRSTLDYDPGHWYHVAVVINDSDEGFLYVNGEVQATFSTTIRPSRTALFSIGQEWDWDASAVTLKASNFFRGMIDEVRVWKVCRTQTQIQDGMFEILRGDETGLVGLWHFDETGNSHFAYDATEYGNDGGGMMVILPAGYPSVPFSLAHVPSNATIDIDMSSDLMAKYNFDGYPPYDSSINGNDGTTHGPPELIKNRFGNNDSAYEFDGVNDYISLSGSLKLAEGDNTVSCWVKIPEDVTGRVGVLIGVAFEILSIDFVFNYEIDDDGHLKIRWEGLPALIGSTDLRDGLWHHIAIVRDTLDHQFYAYIDGVQEILTSHSNIGGDASVGVIPWIGADQRGIATSYFKGAIDDFWIFDRALSNNEIFELADKDNDGLPDSWELKNGYDPLLVDSDIDDIPDEVSIADGDEDPDGDGLINLVEYSLGTDPRETDSDFDGMPDDWEYYYNLDPLTPDGAEDIEGDGLSYLDEYNAETDPNDSDSDDDGLSDGEEVNTYSTDPNDADMDDDGLTDYEEVNTWFSDPNDADSDDDNLTDYEEVNTYNSNPNNPDTDDDGLPDDWEVNNGLNPLNTDDRLSDPDGDGLNSLEEYNAGTDNNDADTDDDGLIDSLEINTYSTDPNDADTDDDDLTDGLEINTWFSDPHDADSDDDDYSDGKEALHDSDPVNSSDTPAPMIIFVKEDNPGTIDGKSWNTAFIDFHKAIELSVSGDEIWVARGTYYPTEEHGGTGDRYKSFQMKNNVSIYGGFAGDETAIDQRDIQVNETILSGDIGIEDDYSDNSFHVFYHPEGLDLDSSAVLDGFTVTGGNGQPAGEEITGYTDGGGMYNEASSPTINNCTFTLNDGWVGGGMYNIDSSPILNKCTFYKNTAVYGGGMSNIHSSPTLINCIFSMNSAPNGGGGMENSGSSPNLINCIFVMNDHYAMRNLGSHPTLTGCTIIWNNGGIYNPDWGEGSPSYPNLINCIMWGNAQENTNEIIIDNGMPTISYSNIQDSGGSDSWNTALGIDGGNNIDTDPLFAEDPEMYSFGYTDAFHLSSGSPCINTGDPSITEGVDIDNEARVFKSIVDMGADEFVDNDNDYLSDFQENTSCTDREDADTDDDGIPDGEEDANLDGIVDPGETDPCDSDTDGDGIQDGIELGITSGHATDTGESFIPDADAGATVTDPLDEDSDDDGLPDRDEDINFNGMVDEGETSPDNEDSDDDGMPDGWEVQNDLDPLYDDADIDEDGDRFSNLKEYQRNTDPNDYNSHPPRSMPWLQLLLDDD